MLSTSCTYGIRAALYLAATDDGTYTPIHQIGRDLGISGPFLAKVLQELKGAGIITSRRGPKGGVALDRDANQITFQEIIVAIDGEALFTECVMGLPGCGTCTPCPLHESWRNVRSHLTALFGGLTIQEVAHEAHPLLSEHFPVDSPLGYTKTSEESSSVP